MTTTAEATWVVLADAARARIFRTDAALTEGPDSVEVLVHPASRAHKSELASDAPGRGKGGTYGGAAASDKHDHEVEVFAKQLAEHLRQARLAGSFHGVVLAAPPTFLGALRGAMDKQTLASIHTTLDKDLTHLTPDELLGSLRNRIG